MECRLQVSSLSADPRHQQPHLRRDASYRRQLLRVGGADHQAQVALRVPLNGPLGDDLI